MDIELTKRQTEVMELLIRAYKIKAIAKKLVVSECTIKSTLNAIYNRMGIDNVGDYDVRILAINKYRKQKELLKQKMLKQIFSNKSECEGLDCAWCTEDCENAR